jgi:hypothetical protein
MISYLCGICGDRVAENMLRDHMEAHVPALRNADYNPFNYVFPNSGKVMEEGDHVCYATGEGEECLGNSRKELERYSDYQLWELVHDLKDLEASNIINCGDEIDYILGEGDYALGSLP